MINCTPGSLFSRRVSVFLTLVRMYMKKRLENKIALITGAARGIGQAIAELFHREGALVILSDIRDDEGRALASALSGAEYRRLDVRHESEWQAITEYLTNAHGGLDVLVNNAGITGFSETNGPFDAENVDLRSWDEVHRVNASGVMLGCKYAIAMMKARGGGSIVNMSSRSGLVGIPGAVAYASSKASVRNHSKSVALYCAEKRYNIRCNSIHPAAIMTPMWDAMLGEGAQREAMINSIEYGIPMGHFGEPMDVAYGALYLASDESKYVTGIELTIDGGILAGSEASPGQEDPA
jgi:3(or 17)beta-hydroxysteroid dehydrogenase